MVDGGPLNRSPLAEFVIDNHPHFLGDIVNRLQSVVCIASIELNGKLHVKFIRAEDWEVAIVKADRRSSVRFPLLVFYVDHYPTPDAPPQPIG